MVTIKLRKGSGEKDELMKIKFPYIHPELRKVHIHSKFHQKIIEILGTDSISILPDSFKEYALLKDSINSGDISILIPDIGWDFWHIDYELSKLLGKKISVWDKDCSIVIEFRSSNE